MSPRLATFETLQRIGQMGEQVKQLALKAQAAHCVGADEKRAQRIALLMVTTRALVDALEELAATVDAGG